MSTLKSYGATATGCQGVKFPDPAAMGNLGKVAMWGTRFGAYKGAGACRHMRDQNQQL